MNPLEQLRRYATKDNERLDLPLFEEVAARIERRSVKPSGGISFESIGLIVGAAAVVAVIIVTVSGSAVVPAGVAGSAVPSPAAPSSAAASASPGAIAANTGAFRGLGRLAFSTSSGLHVLDGTSGDLVRVADAGLARWSSDGSWLAYVQRSGSGVELWLVRPDGTGREKAGALPSSSNFAFEWSPKDTVLAVAPQSGPAGDGLWLLRPGRTATLLSARGTAVASFAWSPDGDTIAYSITLPSNDPAGRSDALLTVGVRSAVVQQRLVAERAGIVRISWWPDGRGLLYYRDPDHSASLLMDGVPLESFGLDGSRKTGVFADHRIDTFNAWVDSRRFVAVLGVDRWPTANRRLAICDIDSISCRAIGPSSPGVDSDPALSFDRSKIAFVRAADRGQAVGFKSDADAQSWIATRTLWVLDMASGTSTEITEVGGGVFTPAWSRDDRQILLARGRSAGLYDLGTASFQNLLTPLDPATPLGGSGWAFNWWR